MWDQWPTPFPPVVADFDLYQPDGLFNTYIEQRPQHALGIQYHFTGPPSLYYRISGTFPGSPFLVGDFGPPVGGKVSFTVAAPSIPPFPPPPFRAHAEAVFQSPGSYDSLRQALVWVPVSPFVRQPWTRYVGDHLPGVNYVFCEEGSPNWDPSRPAGYWTKPSPSDTERVSGSMVFSSDKVSALVF